MMRPRPVHRDIRFPDQCIEIKGFPSRLKFLTKKIKYFVVHVIGCLTDGFNNNLFARYSVHGLNNRHLNSEQVKVGYSDVSAVQIPTAFQK